jgi:phosphate-selective porin OprO/OprP
MPRRLIFTPATASTWPDCGRGTAGRLAFLVMALALLLLTARAHADDPPSGAGPATGEDEGSLQETPPPDDDAAEPEDDEVELTGFAKINPLRVHWDNGLHIEGKWDYLHVKIAGDVQNDTAGFLNTESVEDYLGTEIEGGVEWRRARAYAEGRLFRHLDFKLRYDFTAGNPPNLKDAYFSFVNLPIPTAGFTFGRFKAPLGLDGYTAADDLVFMERSTMSEAFLPSRNTGVMLHGDAPNQRFRWHVAALQPEADDISLSNTDNLGWSARLAWAFTRGKGNQNLVHVGANYWRRNVSETIQYASRPESHLAPFFVDTGDELFAESSNIGVLESAVQMKRWTVEGEFTLAQVSKEGDDSLYFYGFYVQASRFLTGEQRPYRTDRGTFTRPHPKRSLRQGGTGAMELAFRYSRIDLNDRAVSGGILNDWSAGFNWYPTYHLKVMFNAILADLKDAKPTTILQMRLQVAF